MFERISLKSELYLLIAAWVLLGVVSYLLLGWTGIAVFLIGTAVGLLPPV